MSFRISCSLSSDNKLIAVFKNRINLFLPCCLPYCPHPALYCHYSDSDSFNDLPSSPLSPARCAHPRSRAANLVSSRSHAAVTFFACRYSRLCPPLKKNKATKKACGLAGCNSLSIFFSLAPPTEMCFHLTLVPVVWSQHSPTLFFRSTDLADFFSVIEYLIVNYSQNSNTDDLRHFLTTGKVDWSI